MPTWIVETWNKPAWKIFYILAAAILIIGALWKIPQWQVDAYHGQLDATAISKLDAKDLIQLQKDLITAENNARLALAQIIGGLVVLLGLYATFKNVQIAQRNAEIAEEGKLTDRFAKAVEMLGNKDQLNVRLGGIYALERIAKDSLKDHWTVMEVLTAFVRVQTRKDWLKAQALLEDPNDEGEQEFNSLVSQPTDTDIQAALSVIAKRKWVSHEKPDQRINLSRTFITNAVFTNARLDNAIFTFSFLNGAMFFKANLNRAVFNSAQLTRTQLQSAKLNSAKLMNARLGSAYFEGAELNEALLIGSYFAKTNLSNASLANADLTATNIAGAVGLTWEQLSEAKFDQTTKLPPDLEERRRQEQTQQSGEASPAAADEAD